MPITNLLWHIMGYIQLNLHPSQKYIDFAECAMTLTDANGVISSPGFPNSYFSNIDCTWHIRVTPGNIIYLRFLHFAIYHYDK